jgi:hypothetical protein
MPDSSLPRQSSWGYGSTGADPYPVVAGVNPRGARVVVDRSLDEARVRESCEEFHTATFCPVCEPMGASSLLVGSWARLVWLCCECGAYGRWEASA